MIKGEEACLDAETREFLEKEALKELMKNWKKKDIIWEFVILNWDDEQLHDFVFPQPDTNDSY
jgi:hypothetical protein|tara:strand:+ start:412 stop:600 length:189 start_codon:yes stop_codon:yes gene_type:complete